MPVKYKSQLKAMKKYASERLKFAIWYPRKQKKELEEKIKKKGLQPRDVFEAGLNAFKISSTARGQKA